MSAEEAGDGKLTKLVTDHVLRHKYGNVLASIVHHECVTDEYREDSGAA